MPLIRIFLLARALQLSALRIFALLCQTGRCVDPLVSTSCWARERCLVFSWGVVGPTSTLFAGPPPFQAPCWAKGLGGCRSQGCHGYLQAWLASRTAPPKPRHLPQAHRLAMSLNVAECNLGEVKLEPMQSAAVRGKPCAGGSLLQGLLQGHLYCVPATFSFAFVCHS